MSRAIIIQQIARRTGIKNKPRSVRQTGRVMIPEDTPYTQVARKVLSQVKALVRHDGNDRRIDLAEVRTIGNTRHAISSRVLYRIYKSESDGMVHTYKGDSEPQRKKRAGQPAGTVESNLVSIN